MTDRFLPDHTKNIVSKHSQFKNQFVGNELAGRKTFYTHIGFDFTVELLTLTVSVVKSHNIFITVILKFTDTFKIMLMRRSGLSRKSRCFCEKLFSHAISGLTRNRFARIGGIDRSRMSMDSFRLICLSPPGELITNACFLAFLYKLHIFFKRFFGFLRCFVGQMRFTGFIVKIEPFFIVLPNKIFMSYHIITLIFDSLHIYKFRFARHYYTTD